MGSCLWMPLTCAAIAGARHALVPVIFGVLGAALAEAAARFHHLLPPKLGGPLALLEAAPGVDVVLLEHTGFEAATSFATFWNAALVGKTIRVRLRRISATDIPAEGRAAWLFDRWAEVDAWVAAGQSANTQGG